MCPASGREHGTTIHGGATHPEAKIRIHASRQNSFTARTGEETDTRQDLSLIGSWISEEVAHCAGSILKGLSVDVHGKGFWLRRPSEDFYAALTTTVRGWKSPKATTLEKLIYDVQKCMHDYHPSSFGWQGSYLTYDEMRDSIINAIDARNFCKSLGSSSNETVKDACTS